MKKLIVRPCNIPTFALGVDLISYPYVIVNNLSGKEVSAFGEKLNFLDEGTSDRGRMDVEVLRSGEKGIRALAEENEIWIVPYKPSVEMDIYCEENKFGKAYNPPELAAALENKALLNEFFPGADFLIPSENVKLTELSYPELSAKYGDKFIAQPTFETFAFSGGRGTFIIQNQTELEDIKNNLSGDFDVKISKFIDGDTLSINACICHDQILISNFWRHITNAPTCSTNPVSYCGGNYTVNPLYPNDLESRISQITERVAHELKKKEYKGIFNLDLIYDRKADKLFLIEINPRLAGSVGIIDYFHKKNGLPIFLEYHVRAFTGEKIEEEMPVNEITETGGVQIVGVQISGAQIIMRSLEPHSVRIIDSPQPGVYEFDGENINFLRTELAPDKLADNEILIYAIAPEGYHIGVQDRIANIVTNQSVLDPDTYKLTSEYEALTEHIYTLFRFEPSS